MEESSLRSDLKQFIQDCQSLFTNLSERNQSLSEKWGQLGGHLDNQLESANPSEDRTPPLPMGEIAGSFSNLIQYFSQMFEALVGTLQKNEALKKERLSLQAELARFTEQVILLDQARGEWQGQKIQFENRLQESQAALDQASVKLAQFEEQLDRKEFEITDLCSRTDQMDQERTSALAQIKGHESRVTDLLGQITHLHETTIAREEYESIQERFRRLEEEQTCQAQQEAYHIETISRLETQVKSLQEALLRAESEKSQAESSWQASEQAHQQSQQYHRELESRLALLEQALQKLPSGEKAPELESLPAVEAGATPAARIETPTDPPAPSEKPETEHIKATEIPTFQDISGDLTSSTFAIEDTLSEMDILEFEKYSGVVDSLVLREEESLTGGLLNSLEVSDQERGEDLLSSIIPLPGMDTADSIMPEIELPQPVERLLVDEEVPELESADISTGNLVPPQSGEQPPEEWAGDSPTDILDRALNQETQEEILDLPLDHPDVRLGLEDLSKPPLPPSGLLSEPESQSSSPDITKEEPHSTLESATDVLSRMFSNLETESKENLDMDGILESYARSGGITESQPSAPGESSIAEPVGASPVTSQNMGMPFPYPEITGEKLDYFHGKRVLLVGGDERFLSDFQHLFGMAKADLTYFPSLLQLEKKGLKKHLAEADVVVVFGRAVNEPGILRLRQSAEELTCPVVEHLSSGLISLYHHLQKVQ